MMDKPDNIQMTAHSAANCKWSAVSQGYWEDQFVDDFTPEKEKRRQSPFINRAYYGRVASLNSLLKAALAQASSPTNECCQVQLLSLGAGLDTTGFRLLVEPTNWNLVVYEVDQKDVVAAKREMLRSSAAIQEHFKWQKQGDTEAAFILPRYELMVGDLHHFDDVKSSLEESGFDWRLPTVVLVECVLTYISPTASSVLLKKVGSLLGHSAIILYERTGQAGEAVTERISEVLLNRGVELQALSAFKHAADWAQLLRDSGWNHAFGWDLNRAVRQCVGYDDIARVAKIEPFDEYASLAVFQAHYCIAIGSNPRFGSFRVSTSVSQVQDLNLKLTKLEDLIETLSERMDKLEASFLPPNTNGEFIIREYEEKDTQSVRDIIRQSLLEQVNHRSVQKFVKNTMKRQLGNISRDFIGENKSKGRLWVAQSKGGGHILGCVGLVLAAKEAELKHLAVLPEFRRRGIASGLVATLEGYCAETGIQRIILSTLKVMSAANRFYKQKGYQEMPIHHSRPTREFEENQSLNVLEITSYFKDIR